MNHNMQRLHAMHDYTRKHGVNRLVYLTIRLVLQPFFTVWLTLARTKPTEFPDGGVLVIANHRSFLDPFLIACLLPWNRSLHFMAKAELFARPRAGWVMNRGGTLPVRRGESDPEAMETARQILEQGGVLVIFPEGKRMRYHGMGEAKRGAFRLAQETGATILPVTLSRTELVRHKKFLVLPVHCQAHALTPIAVEKQTPTPESAAALRDEAWQQITDKWLQMGGTDIPGSHHRPEGFINAWRLDLKVRRALRNRLLAQKQRWLRVLAVDVRFWKKKKH
jgi:1-acyl-sn-glycerol-3-phosphate acyltransferase